ncbi:hypothetical protein WR25_02667 [Diploscapter pachys]|uniref:Uncharacterized protein n=1 Tax=Diploscapter pachys TaxID=2018661 RepID=A0A2A2K1E7_9BILA|nr:hypothetical protein WR25_02667 [Diploscapter pachys]
MEVAASLRAPADELDAQLEAAAGRAQELGFVDAEEAVEAENRRNGGFAYAHRADRVGFDQGNRSLAVGQEASRGGRHHPAGGATADDQEPADRLDPGGGLGECPRLQRQIAREARCVTSHGERIITTRTDTLADQDGMPGRRLYALLVAVGQGAALRELLHRRGKRRRQAVLGPERPRRRRSGRQMVRGEPVAQGIGAHAGEAIVFEQQALRHGTGRQQLQRHPDLCLREGEADELQRAELRRRLTDRQAVVAPEALLAPGGHFGQRGRRAGIVEHRPGRRLVAQRGGKGYRAERTPSARPIRGPAHRPPAIARPNGRASQQGRWPAGVHEQVGGQALTALQAHCSQCAVFPSHDTGKRRRLPGARPYEARRQGFGQQAGIETHAMVGRIERRGGVGGERACLGHGGGGKQVVERRHGVSARGPQPALVQRPPTRQRGEVSFSPQPGRRAAPAIEAGAEARQRAARPEQIRLFHAPAAERTALGSEQYRKPVGERAGRDRRRHERDLHARQRAGEAQCRAAGDHPAAYHDDRADGRVAIGGHRSACRRTTGRQRPRQGGGIDTIGTWIPAIGKDALADEDGDPAGRPEQAEAVPRNMRTLTPQVDLVPQRVRYRHGADMIPKGRIVAGGRVIVQDQEVPDALVLGIDRGVEAVPVRRGDLPRREMLEQMGDGGLDEPDPHDVTHPAAPPPPGAEAQEARSGEGLSLDRVEQRPAGRIVIRERAGIDVTVADAVAQRDPPSPARVRRVGTCERRDRAGRRR